VSLAPDLSTARVFFTPFASSHSAEEARIGLTHAGGFLRGEVGRRLGLRHAPRLTFVIDDTLERAEHLTGLIDRAVGKPDRGSDPGDDSAPH
jgi:ribosome-binding factor A